MKDQETKTPPQYERGESLQSKNRRKLDQSEKLKKDVKNY